MDKENLIGIVLPVNQYNHLSKPGPKLKAILSFYEKAARMNDLSICYFRFKDLKSTKEPFMAYVKRENSYVLWEVAKPWVIYKRTGHRSSINPLIESLMNEGIRVFNSYRNNNKYKIYKMVRDNEELNKHQPETKIASPRTINEMMSQFNSLMIKPDNGEVGRGIMKLEKMQGDIWCLYEKSKERKKGLWKQTFFEDELPTTLLTKIKNRRYLVQQTIDLATFSGNPFDMRVSTQRNHLGEWQVSAIIVKVATDGQFLTNVGQGGTTTTIEYILADHPVFNLEKVKMDICDLALKLANHISLYKKDMADFGFDIGLSKDGIPYLIEVNHVSDYGTLALKNGKLIANEWKDVFTTPINYARFLLAEVKRVEEKGRSDDS